jgi:hypothetical protein
MREAVTGTMLDRLSGVGDMVVVSGGVGVLEGEGIVGNAVVGVLVKVIIVVGEEVWVNVGVWVSVMVDVMVGV